MSHWHGSVAVLLLVHKNPTFAGEIINHASGNEIKYENDKNNVSGVSDIVPQKLSYSGIDANCAF